jgi:hypothetical protein
MDEVAKKRQRDGWKVKILRLQESMGEVLDQFEGVSIKLSETEKAVEL